jgi:hypothetical protein
MCSSYISMIKAKIGAGELPRRAPSNRDAIVVTSRDSRDEPPMILLSWIYPIQAMSIWCRCMEVGRESILGNCKFTLNIN